MTDFPSFDKITFWCQECDTPLKVGSKKASQDIPCPACKKEVTVPEESTITIGYCMHCGKRFQHYESSFPTTHDCSAGQATCLKCKKQFSFYKIKSKFYLDSVVPETEERLQSLMLSEGLIEEESTVESHRSIGIKKISRWGLFRHQPPYPDNCQIYVQREPTAGVYFRKDDFIKFANYKEPYLKFEREPENPHDPNAIKVIGYSKGLFETKSYFLGYVSADLAKQIVESGCYGQVFPRISGIYISEGGNSVDLHYDLIGPKSEKEKFRRGFRTWNPHSM